MMINKGIFSVVLLSMSLFLGACGGGNSGTSSMTLTDVNVATFDGVWYSPCFNNSHGYSARQKITINSTSLISEISSYTAGTTQSHNCVLPGSGILIDSDITATMVYGSTVSHGENCNDSAAVETNISISQVESSGNNLTTQPDMNNSITLLTADRDNFLPDSTVICLKSNGNLLFAGQEYTGSTNTEIVGVTAVVVTSDTAVTWKLGDYNFNAGTAGGSSVSVENTDLGFRSMVVSTSGFDTSNDDYSGSSLTILHTLQGPGEYSLNDDSSYMLQDNASHKRMTIRVTAGTLSPNASLYSATSGTAVVSVDSSGRYHISVTSPIQLTKLVDVGTGIPNAPATLSFTMNNIHDYQN